MASSIIYYFRGPLPFDDCVQSFDPGVEMRTLGNRDTDAKVSLIRTQQFFFQSLTV